MILKNFLLTTVFLLLSAVPAEAQKKSETPQKRDTFEYTFDLPKYVEQLKLELTYPLAWRNQQNMPFDLWKEKARAKVFECMMTPPKAADRFDPEIIGREKRDGYVALKVMFNVNAYSRIMAYILVPDGKGPFPAVNLLHDHGAHFFIGKEKMIRPFGVSKEVADDAQNWANTLYEGQFVGDYLARHGYVCFCMDAPLWGERGREEGVDRSKYDIIAGNMMMLGRDLCGFMHYDDIASTDFPATLPTEEMHEVWKSQGADDKLDTEIWDIPHSCHKDVQLKMLHFLDEYLK